MTVFCLATTGLEAYDDFMKRFMVPLFILSCIACSQGPHPKDTVFNFIDAVLKSDSLKVLESLDLATYASLHVDESVHGDSTAFVQDYASETLQSLLGDGRIRRRWLRSQIIVNKETIDDGTAEVEVSFIDRASSHMIYTRMQLEKQPDRSWLITYFR